MDDFKEKLKPKLEELKATGVILLFITLIIAIFVIPFVLFQSGKQNDENFPEYQNINIDKSELDDTSYYDSVRNQLESDYYFTKLALMPDYNSERYTSQNLDKLIWNMIFNFELKNDEHFSFTDKEKNIYCLRKRDFIKAFKELYNVDIEDDMYLLKGYYKYVYEKKQGYCMDFGNVSKDYVNDIKIGVERLAVIGTTITTDIKVYEYYTPDMTSSNTYVYQLENAIRNKNYTEAKDIVENKLHGKVSTKQMKFKMNKRGKYFKYTILSVNKLDY